MCSVSFSVINIPSGSYLPLKIKSKNKYLGVVTDEEMGNYTPLIEKSSSLVGKFLWKIKGE